MRLHPPCLGNFLSGMETFQAVASNGFPVAALETSLVEWKRRGGTIMKGYNKALETSLVEWKLENALSGATADMRLGNFLSGMETSVRPFYHDHPVVPWKLP